jgi:hypothetical protein
VLNQICDEHCSNAEFSTYDRVCELPSGLPDINEARLARKYCVRVQFWAMDNKIRVYAIVIEPVWPGDEMKMPVQRPPFIFMQPLEALASQNWVASARIC